MDELPPLSFTDWIVLALIAERPSHGFAVAALTAEGADIGEIWHISPPVIYRSVNHLAGIDLIRAVSVEGGDRGPQRTIFAVSAEGGQAVARWLGQPVTHVRDVRSELLVKLTLLSRRGEDLLPLIGRQRSVVLPIEAALSQKAAELDHSCGIVILWRLESARATLRFLDALDADRFVVGPLVSPRVRSAR